MPITKRTFIDQITLDLENGTTLWRETTVFEEDGIELHRIYHRGSAEADSTIPLPAEAAPFRAQIVTPEKIAKAIAKREALDPTKVKAKP